MNIQIIKVYKESFQNVFSHKLEWFRLGFVPFFLWVLSLNLILVPFGFSESHFDVKEMKLFYTDNDPTVFFVSLIISTVFYYIINFMISTSLSLTGYRYALLHEGGKKWITYSSTRLFLKLVGYGIFVGSLTIAYLLMSVWIIKEVHSFYNNPVLSIGLIVAFALYGFYLLCRIALYALVISLDHKEPLKTSWHLMKGNVLRMITLFVFVWLTMTFLGLVGAFILGYLTKLLSEGGVMLLPLSGFLGILFSFFLLIFNWSITSKAMGLIYQKLTS